MKELTHLSVVDGAFLHLESPEMPMHVRRACSRGTPPPCQGGMN